MTAVFLSPMTNYSLGRGAASGFWAAYLKSAGYDGIIIEGAAAKPTYLFVNDGKPELRDAGRFWGKAHARPRIYCGRTSASKTPR